MRGYGVSALVAAGLLLVGPLDPAEAGRRGPKRSTITEVIIHATGGPSCEGGKVVFSDPGTVERIRQFFERTGGVSIHYIVGRDGEVVASVPEDEVAYHVNEWNETSIGIELINQGDGSEPFPEPQILALAALVHGIRERHRIPLARILGHSDVDDSTFTCGGRRVRRKQDPGPAFPWERFRFEVLIAGSYAEAPPVAGR